MKNSAWYHNLWRKKLDKYPIKEDAGTSWSEMQALLDQHLPDNNSSDNKKTSKLWGGTIIPLLGFILPAAAMIGAITYIAVKHPFKNKEVNKHHYHLTSKRTNNPGMQDSLDKLKDTVNVDSGRITGENITAANTAQINKAKLLPGRPMANTVLSGSNRISNQRANASNKYPPGSVIGLSGNPKGASQTGALSNNVSANNKVNQDSLKQIEKKSDSKTDINGTGNQVAVKPDKTGQERSKVTKEKTGRKNKAASIKKIRAPKLFTGASAFDFDISAALNAGKGGSNVVFGIGGSYELNPKWLINARVKMDLNRPLSATFTHPSYSRPDTSFYINDSRKLNIITVPITIEYKISDIISINAGPQLSFSVKQSKLSTKLGTVLDRRDTLYHTHTVDSGLMINRINKINVGVSGGVSIRLNQFYIDGTYQQNVTPYNVTTGLGGYKQYYRSFQIGLRYKFKLKGHQQN